MTFMFLAAVAASILAQHDNLQTDAFRSVAAAASVPRPTPTPSASPQPSSIFDYMVTIVWGRSPVKGHHPGEHTIDPEAIDQRVYASVPGLKGTIDSMKTSGSSSRPFKLVIRQQAGQRSLTADEFNSAFLSSKEKVKLKLSTGAWIESLYPGAFSSPSPEPSPAAVTPSASPSPHP